MKHSRLKLPPPPQSSYLLSAALVRIDNQALLVNVSGVGEIGLTQCVAALTEADVGSEVILAYNEAQPDRSVVLGRCHRHARSDEEPPHFAIDSDRVEITADNEITLTCGKASITLTRSGKIVLRGTYILSRSSGPNRIKGGSIELN